MPVTPEQQAEIAELRSNPRPTLRAVSEGMEAHLYKVNPVLDHGFVRVIDYMGDDAAICQAARVSYGKGTKSVQNDEGLIRYLMRHWHSTPFEMCEVKLHVKLPVFVARQWIRHRTANVNEYSARYSILDREFYIPAPEQLAAQSVVNNQGRGAALTPEESARVVSSMGLPGIAVGGVSVGEPAEEMHRIVRQVGPLLPEDKPHYLMGVGTLPEMAIAVANGFDVFDCVLPTRLGRHGAALVGGERWNLKNARFRHDHTPLDPSCSCPACTVHSRAYLHHLIKTDELLGKILLSLHNITQLVRFSSAMARAIRDGCFAEDFAPWEPDSPAAHTW